MDYRQEGTDSTVQGKTEVPDQDRNNNRRPPYGNKGNDRFPRDLIVTLYAVGYGFISTRAYGAKETRSSRHTHRDNALPMRVANRQCSNHAG